MAPGKPRARNRKSRKKTTPAGDVIETRGRKSPFYGAPLSLLESWFPRYVEAKVHRRSSFWSAFWAEWYQRFPPLNKSSGHPVESSREASGSGEPIEPEVSGSGSGEPIEPVEPEASGSGSGEPVEPGVSGSGSALAEGLGDKNDTATEGDEAPNEAAPEPSEQGPVDEVTGISPESTSNNPPSGSNGPVSGEGEPSGQSLEEAGRKGQMSSVMYARMATRKVSTVF